MTSLLASTNMTVIKPASSQDVRKKFFETIGIEAKKSPGTVVSTQIETKDATSPVASAAANKEWVHPRTQRVSSFQERLKYDAHADKIYAPKRRDGEGISKKSKKQKKSLTFDEKVKVLPIPMRNEYSNRVRSRLWSNAMEIQENAARNTVEFAAEGWNWRSVLEDDRMYVCMATAELIHPCHYEQGFFQHGFR